MFYNLGEEALEMRGGKVIILPIFLHLFHLPQGGQDLNPLVGIES